jgi:hypothetical protein
MKRTALCFAVAMLPGVLMGLPAKAQTAQPDNRMTGAAPRTEESLRQQAPIGHRQPRATDMPSSPEKTAADRERERKDRELDKRLRICRDC